MSAWYQALHHDHLLVGLQALHHDHILVNLQVCLLGIKRFIMITSLLGGRAAVASAPRLLALVRFWHHAYATAGFLRLGAIVWGGKFCEFVSL